MSIIESAHGPCSPADGLFGCERALPELLGEVMTRAGIGLILAAGDGEMVYANQLASTLLRASGGLRCERNSLPIQGIPSSRRLQPLIVAASRHRDELAQGGTLSVWLDHERELTNITRAWRMPALGPLRRRYFSSR